MLFFSNASISIVIAALQCGYLMAWEKDLGSTVEQTFDKKTLCDKEKLLSEIYKAIG